MEKTPKRNRKKRIDQETFDIIEKIAEEHSFKTFGYLEKNDLKNEIWVICLKKIKDFEGNRGEMEHFLRVVVKNRMINRFKDITKSVRSPCPRCPFFDKVEGRTPCDCKKFGENRMECNKWSSYQLSIESRNSLLNASNVESDPESDTIVPDRVAGAELRKTLQDNLPPEFMRDFDDYMAGNKMLKRKKDLLIQEIKRITNPNDENEAE